MVAAIAGVDRIEAVPDRDRAEQLRAGTDRHVVLERRVALAGGEARAAERHALVERDVVADLGRLADHDAHAVVDEDATADGGAGMDLDAGQPAAVCKVIRSVLVECADEDVDEPRVPAMKLSWIKNRFKVTSRAMDVQFVKTK